MNITVLAPGVRMFTEEKKFVDEEILKSELSEEELKEIREPAYCELLEEFLSVELALHMGG